MLTKRTCRRSCRRGPHSEKRCGNLFFWAIGFHLIYNNWKEIAGGKKIKKIKNKKTFLKRIHCAR